MNSPAPFALNQILELTLLIVARYIPQSAK